MKYESYEQYDDIMRLFEEYGDGMSFCEWAGCKPDYKVWRKHLLKLAATIIKPNQREEEVNRLPCSRCHVRRS